MLIFLDFDDVLFNTRKFKDDYFDLFKKRGVTKDVFEKFYYDPLDKRNTKSYSPIGHIKRVCRQSQLNYSEFEEDVMQFTQNTDRYVFNDTIKFLENFSKKELCLISFSKTNFQKSKIFNSGIIKYFNQIEIVDELKGKAIEKIIKLKSSDISERIYFIDDRVEHLTDAKIKNPNIITIFLLRKEGRHRDRRNKFCDYKVTSTREILKIIKSK
ncbi:MAG: hypothetical protein RBS77_01975 [Candidatus Moranbacteria bacterium]|jgi:FMN phosphatase YigB (HAD superfamily)|nr:hypothetical protein [Candidatus Moranbacteria bacterium]